MSEQLHRSIIDLFEKSELPVLFAGAGVSCRAGLPSWPQYMSELAGAVFEYDEITKFQMDSAIRDGALEDAAAYYKMCRKMPSATKLKALVTPLAETDVSGLECLVKLPFASYVTTNFDRCLFTALAAHAGKAAREVNIDDPTLSSAVYSTDLYVARIHGRVDDPQSMRLTGPELDALKSCSPYVQFLNHLITRRRVFFVGYSFLDPAIRAVLKSISISSRHMHGQEHVAFVPKSATSEFLGELEAHSIHRIAYDDRENHKLLWDAFCLAAKALSKRSSASRSAALRTPFEIAKRYLATSYARMRIGGPTGPLARTIAEGVVSGIVRQSGAAGIDEAGLIERVEQDLTLTRDAAVQLVSSSVSALMKEGIVTETGGAPARYTSQADEQNGFHDALSRLVDGAMNRYVVRERGTDAPSTRRFLEAVFLQLVLQRGWDLGAAFASRRVPEPVDVEGVMSTVEKSSARLSDDEFIALTRSVEDLLTRPDDAEAALLSELGRVAFGLELLTEAPHDANFFRNALPERIYLDANVIMPAITRGHPHHQLISSTIATLRAAVEASLLRVEVCVYEGFLNEIVSHRQLALDAMRENHGEGALWAEREAGLLGTANVNVYIGSFLNLRATESDLSFDDFVTKQAPYRTEGELREYLKRFGVRVVRDSEAQKWRASEILHGLEKFYADQIQWRRKSGKVIAHDAAQIAMLGSDLQSGRKTLFVSADRSLRVGLVEHGFREVTSVIISHIGFSQLVELLVGRVGANRGMASLLWTSSVSTDTERVRNYLLALALKEHDAALAMEMTDVVDAISEDIGLELQREKLVVDSDLRESRAKFHRVMERYESEFFARMRKEIERKGSSSIG